MWSDLVKFELLLDIMHFLNIYKFKMDQTNSNQENVTALIFRRLRATNSVVGSGRISNSSKLFCMSLLPASMKSICSRTAEKKWQHRFPHNSLWGFFSDAQGQLTLQSVVGSGRNSNSTELSSLPLSIKRIE